MKRIAALTAFIIAIIFNIQGQYGYIPEKLSGDLYLRDLTNPGNATLIGTGPTQIGASDFDLNGNLYAISESNNTLYQIDTANASSTVIATLTPSGSEFWSGMACDPTDGTVYICSTDGNNNSFYTLDVSNGNTSLVGTNNADDGVVGIAFTDDGQMYAIYLVGKFYMIDKSNGAATFIGNMNNAARGLTHHGLDFDSETQTMYMVSYNVFTFDNELWTINLATGANTLVGSVVVWTGTIAVKPIFAAAFSADNTEICEGDVVNFTDQSTGAVSWTWTFEGGTPATSTAQNPSVTYNASGVYDVTLEVSDGNATSTLVETDFISVESLPAQAGTPAGPDETCQGGSYDYTTTTIGNADSYDWQVDPSDAGTISGTGTTGTFTAATDWSGAYTVEVRGVNECGNGSWSPALSATLFEASAAYFITGGGGYCEGGPGRELILDGSEIGFDYELLFEGLSTGIVLAGTGDSLNFGYHTDEGLYTAEGYSSNCTTTMFGQAFVSIQPAPGPAGIPQGSTETCNNSVDEYTTSGADDADTLYWYIDPANAAILTPGDLMVSIDWDEAFSGMATLSVYGDNDCGMGDTASLEITVSLAPTPVVEGLQLVCVGEQAEYSTEENAGNTYDWEVNGGDIISGAGTHMITVEWGAPGTGSVIVTENDGNCEGTSGQLEVTIVDCVGIDEISANELKVYPNPANDKLYISLSANEISELILVNAFGQIILNWDNPETNKGEIVLDINKLQNGIYFLKISSRDQIITSKFVKQN